MTNKQPSIKKKSGFVFGKKSKGFSIKSHKEQGIDLPKPKGFTKSTSKKKPLGLY